MRYDDEMPDRLSDDVLRTLRAVYTPPADASYWDDLERRIVDRIKGAAPAEWWSVFEGWTRLGLIAAGIVAIITAAVASRARENDARIAYETAIEAPEGTLAEIERESIIGGAGATPEDQTLRFLLPR
jgi:hypothetical protein